jgi:hypothetical protein
MIETREYRHPEINHTFIIEDINISENRRDKS